MPLSKSARYYRDNPAAAKRKAAYDKKLNSRPTQVNKREESNKARYNARKNGKNIRGLDYDHSVKRFVKSSTNRGRTHGTAGDRNARGRMRFGRKK